MDKRLLIAQPIARELDKFNIYYKESIFCENPRVQEIIDYVLKSDGKRIRPILLLLAAKANGQINQTSYNAAVTIELLHTASLIHDDVVDESAMRRGVASLNAVYDNKMAILAGDYYLSTALIKSVMTGNLEIIADISNLGRSLAEGELNQLSLVKKLILDEAEYFEVIRKKTASLLSACMKIGALSVDAPQSEVDKFAKLGDILGICFQLRDDIFDYFKADVGKPTGNDIREGKITLPLLHTILKAPQTEKDELCAIISSYDFTTDNIERLIKYAIDNGGVDYAYQQMDGYQQKAEEIINTISDNEVRQALLHTVDYIVERKY